MSFIQSHIFLVFLLFGGLPSSLKGYEKMQNPDIEELEYAKSVAESYPDSAKSIAFSIIQSTEKLQVKMDAHFLLGEIARDSGEEEESFFHLNNAESIAYQIDDTHKIVDILCEKAFVYKNLIRMPDSALNLFTKAQNIAKVVKYPHGEIISGMGLSYLKMDNGQYIPAMDILLSLKSKFKSKSMTYEYGSLLNNIGHTYMEIGMYPEAIEQFKEAIEQFRSEESLKMVLLIHANLAETYYKLDSVDRALNIINSIAPLVKQSENIFIKGLNAKIQGDVYLSKKQFKNALEIFDEAINAKYNNNFALNYRLDIGRAKAYWGLENYQKAHEIVVENLNTINNEDDLPLIDRMEGYKILSESYSYLKQWESAMKYANLYQQSYEAIYSEKNRANIFRNEANSRLELQREQDKLENDLLKEKVKTEEREVFILIIISIFLLAGIIVFVIRFIQKNKLNNLLETKNEELNISKQEIALKNDELKETNKQLEESHKEIEEQNEQLEFTNEMMVSINESLEKLIQSRAKEITHKDEVLQEYAFINAHKLRAPVARILGLCKLVNHSNEIEETEDLVKKILQEVRDLDRIVLTITNTIIKGENPERKDLEE